MFRDIVKTCSFKSVKESLLSLYPEQKKNINGYKDVFETLRLMRPRYNNEGMLIDIRRVGKGKNAYFAVSGICLKEDVQQLYALEYTPWSKWLGYEVDQATLKKMPGEDIVAHCLWEMTFVGFTQKEIRIKLALLRKQVKDIEEGRVKTIPHEEVMALFEEKMKGGKTLPLRNKK